MKKLMKQAHQLTSEIKDKFPEVDYQVQLGLSMSYLHKQAAQSDLIKKEESNDFEDGMLMLVDSNSQPIWVAEIVGTHDKYVFDRAFINDPTTYKGRCTCFELEDGVIYNWQESKSQKFGIMENGKLYEVTKTDVKNMLANA